MIVDEPLVIRGPLAELDTPLAERQWLARGEAADYLGVNGRTLHGYFKAGLLPNSRKLTGTWRVYQRADLERIRSRPRRGVYLERVALLRAIYAP